MNSARFPPIREYRLFPPGHPQGASCDADGLALGPIRLLVKNAYGLEPRPVGELNNVFTRTFGRPIDCAGLLPGLRTVARALNEGNRALAAIAATQLRLPYLSEEEARRAAIAEVMNKAAPDDPKHPGWPAGAPDGRGGEFRPKNEDLGESVKRARRKKTGEELQRHFKRVLLREALRRLLTPQRAVRLVGEAAANAVPGLNIAADVALVADIAQMAADFEELRREAEAALDFIKKGPYELRDLRVDAQERSFSSYAEFKKLNLIKFYGPAGDGFEYHHLVEQANQGAITPRELNSTRYIVRIPKLLHEEINGEYGRNDEKTGVSLRTALKGKPFGEQLEEGIKVLRDMGIIR